MTIKLNPEGMNSNVRCERGLLLCVWKAGIEAGNEKSPSVDRRELDFFLPYLFHSFFFLKKIEEMSKHHTKHTQNEKRVFAGEASLGSFKNYKV